jgi:hypothetical protein
MSQVPHVVSRRYRACRARKRDIGKTNKVWSQHNLITDVMESRLGYAEPAITHVGSILRGTNKVGLVVTKTARPVRVRACERNWLCEPVPLSVCVCVGARARVCVWLA